MDILKTKVVKDFENCCLKKLCRNEFTKQHTLYISVLTSFKFTTIRIYKKVFLSRFEIIRCSYCGSGAIHIYCGGLKRKAPFYVCDQHESSLEDMKDHEKKAKKKLKELNIDDNDDEICPINDEHLIRPAVQSSIDKTSVST